jgi:hypothetical protein
MATKMMVSGRYGTHLPCLIKIMERTDGDVLELGMGVFSTPYLHYKCLLDNRKLVSYENFKEWMHFFIRYGYENENHEINFVENYKEADIDKEWDLVLIDQTPDSSRIEEVKRLSLKAKYIVIHDSNENMDNVYHYSEIYPMFKYKKVWSNDSNHATVLSNYFDLEDLW